MVISVILLIIRTVMQVFVQQQDVFLSAIGTFLTGAFSSANVNITDMVNKSRGDYAYSVLDVETKINEDVVHKIAAIKGVLKVRIVK